ncbi:MAG TPA: hypothetical protein VND01_00050 [Candidatus Acidoferrales bacterium]|nr:hypothetical protein [Candidatus Acidoferrales bacterium]
MKEICKRGKKHKESVILKPRLCHDCVIAEGKSEDLHGKEKTRTNFRWDILGHNIDVVTIE